MWQLPHPAHSHGPCHPHLCPLPQDVLSTVPERNAAGRLEDLSGEPARPAAARQAGSKTHALHAPAAPCPSSSHRHTTVTSAPSQRPSPCLSPARPAVHLCFICVLHLANEHGLVVRSVPQLDQLLISNVPPAEAQ